MPNGVHWHFDEDLRSSEKHGAETDLDLGHYERFTNCVLSRSNSTTSGQVYESATQTLVQATDEDEDEHRIR